MKRMTFVIVLCLFASLSLCLSASASFLRLTGLSAGISGIVSDDTDFDTVNIAKLATLSSGKYIGDFGMWRENMWLDPSFIGIEGTDTNYWANNYLVLPISSALNLAFVYSQSNDYIEGKSYVFGTLGEEETLNEFRGRYGVAASYAMSDSLRLGLALDGDFSEQKGYGTTFISPPPSYEVSQEEYYGWLGLKLGIESDISKDTALGAQINYRSGNSLFLMDKTVPPLAMEVKPVGSNSELGFTFTGQQRVGENTVLRGLCGFTNTDLPATVDYSGTEMDAYDYLNSDFVGIGVEIKPARLSTVAFGIYSEGGSLREGMEDSDEMFERSRSTYVFAGLESPVLNMDNLILRASVYNYNYSAWGVGVSGPEDEWSVEYNFGLGYRPINNVLLDVAYASMGDSRPVDMGATWTDAYKYSFPSVNFGVTVDL